ncbi:type II secretion system F family protein [Pararobbsia silviterrae]|uniref:Pilus assembly protein n=1 Tax=Pararobbsia silviterrae TaxID=1792498 RepID=A0A494XKJ5_9BURK|nr:type II secretion system F family protein [Pararobbsia silviterrae]RKP50262.1 pilus assembly protein [Pararobbsia silviterrae]
MPSVLAGIAAFALLLIALALWLWQRATFVEQRASVQRFVDSHVAAPAATRGPAGAHEASALEQALRRWSAPHVERAMRIAHRAGIHDIARFYLIAALVLAVLGLFVWIRLGWIASVAVVIAAAACLRFVLWQRAVAQQQRIVTQLPGFLDGVVRMITIGNSVPAAFQAAVPSADLPLRECLERASRMMRAGVEIDSALLQLAELYRVEAFMLIAAVVRLSVRYGGRADIVLERMAAFMRDREMAERELRALSAETRLSAWILGVLPLAIGGFIVFRNPSYFVGMWNDATGRDLLYGALGLQASGAFLLYRLAKL